MEAERVTRAGRSHRQKRQPCRLLGCRTATAVRRLCSEGWNFGELDNCTDRLERLRQRCARAPLRSVHFGASLTGHESVRRGLNGGGGGGGLGLAACNVCTSSTSQNGVHDRRRTCAGACPAATQDDQVDRRDPAVRCTPGSSPISRGRTSSRRRRPIGARQERERQ